MAFIFRRLRANQNGDAGDEESDDEEEALLEYDSGSDSSGKLHKSLSCHEDHVIQTQIMKRNKNQARLRIT